MAETIRLNKVLRELNISIDRAVDFLKEKGIEIEKRPTTKISDEIYEVLSNEFQTDASKKVASKEVSEAKLREKEALRVEREHEIEERRLKQEASQTEIIKAKAPLEGPKQVGKIDLEKPKKESAKIEQSKKEEKPKEKVKEPVKEKPVQEKPKEKETVKATVKAPEEEIQKEEKVTTQYKKLTGPKETGQKRKSVV